jgi:hypothetical protein
MEQLGIVACRVKAHLTCQRVDATARLCATQAEFCSRLEAAAVATADAQRSEADSERRALEASAELAAIQHQLQVRGRTPAQSTDTQLDPVTPSSIH